MRCAQTCDKIVCIASIELPQNLMALIFFISQYEPSRNKRMDENLKATKQVNPSKVYFFRDFSISKLSVNNLRYYIPLFFLFVLPGLSFINTWRVAVVVDDHAELGRKKSLTPLRAALMNYHRRAKILWWRSKTKLVGPVFSASFIADFLSNVYQRSGGRPIV